MKNPRLGLVLALACACGSTTPGVSRPRVDGAGGSGTGDPRCALDADGDGLRACEDCDDGDAVVHPGALEICADGIDQDCDGVADDGCICHPGDRRSCWDGDPQLRSVGGCTDGNQRCTLDGQWGPCAEARYPAEDRACDGVDQDCDGVDGPGCSSCLPRREICGDGIDQDCDGVADQPQRCSFSCRGVDPGADPSMACCADPDALRYEYRCIEAPGLPPCPERECVDVDGDLATRCDRQCDGGLCLCGAWKLDSPPTPSAACGFETLCARQDCDDRREQPCYTGPVGTLGQGLCRGGFASCLEGPGGARAWGACEGQVVPSPELCGTGVDEDCDGLTDEDDGATGHACPLQLACEGEELCNSSLDEDCDGFVDEGCAARISRQGCYPGPPATLNVGRCRAGLQVNEDGIWGLCRGPTLPGPERCGDGVDSDCNGRGGKRQEEDPGCCSPQEEVCNGIDDDCDGLPDDGLRSHCGRCDTTPCFVTEFPAPADCTAEGRSCEQVAQAGEGFTLAAPAAFEPLPQLAVHAEGAIRVYDTATGQARFAIPSREPYFAARALDGTFWRGQPLETGGAIVEHLDPQGGQLCWWTSVDTLHSLAIGAAGEVLLLFPRLLVALHPERTLGDRCSPWDLSPRTDADTLRVTRTNGALVPSGLGLLWVVGSYSVDRVDLPLLDDLYVSTSVAPEFGGLGRPDGGLWLDGSPVTGVAAHGPYSATTYEHETRTPVSMAGISPGVDGLWGAWRAAVRFDPDTMGYLAHAPPSGDTVDRTLVDEEGTVYLAVRDASFVPRIRRRTEEGWETFAEARVTGPDLSRRALHQLAEGRGLWSQVVNGVTSRATWHGLSWKATVPAGARLAMSVRFADTVGGLDHPETICGPVGFEGYLDLRGCTGGAAYHFARIDAELFAGPQGAGPVVSEVVIEWSRP